MRSLELHGDPLVLRSVTPFNVGRWVRDQREGKLPDRRKGRAPRRLQDDTIAPRHAALKAFTHRFIYRELGMTTCDLLERVDRFAPPRQTKVKDGITEGQLEKLLSEAFDERCYEQLRDKAFVALVASTGLRFSSVLGLEIGQLDRITGEVTVQLKGGRTGKTFVSPKAMQMMRRYLARRPRPAEGECDALFLTERGKPLSYWEASRPSDD